MKRFIVAVVQCCVLAVSASAAVTLDYCLARAEENYPLIRKYGIVERTADLSLSDINKSWLPRVGIYGQVTVQNDVPEFPQSLADILAQMGQQGGALDRTQYKLGVDVSQTIWDGGASRSQRAIERAAAWEQKAAVDVEIYAVRERVMNLYFGILLLDEQMAQTRNTLTLLGANRKLMQSMLAGGVAMQSDVDMIEAQMLTVKQQLSAAQSSVKAYRTMLSLYIGEEVGADSLVRPDASMPSSLEPASPELALFDARRRVVEARRAAVESTVMPKVGFFAQAYYGYPGFNYFKSMTDGTLSLNLLAGVKVSWAIDSFYTKRNSQRRLALSGESIANDRDVFLFNTRLRTCAQTEEIEGLRAVMADDERIVALRGNVRLAAESQLRNGVIDATALLTKITDESQARLTASYHEVQLLQSIYRLKNILNR